MYLGRAHGSEITCIDGHTHIDFALGDTGAMAGHSPAAIATAVHERVAGSGGITTMLPTAQAEEVAAELTRRFGLPLWSFTLSATDANRWAIRLARLVTGRPKILVFAYCYHGSVDETFAVPGPDGVAVSRPGNVAPPVSLHETTRVVEFNDLEALARELAHGDVAAVLTEPALTNIGIVAPEPGFLDGVRRLCDETGALLMIDETHTISVGPGGATRAWGLRPDIFIIGKSIGGGIPSGAYGITAEVAARVTALAESGAADIIDVGGVGGTLAGNALSTAAMHATLMHVLTDDVFVRMTALCDDYSAGVRSAIDAHGLPWSLVQLGARAEYRFTSPAPRTGSASAAAADDLLDEFAHLFLSNRGLLITPFHNMALMGPDTTAQQVAEHTRVFEEMCATLVGPAQ
ncbi:MAG: aminotransferase class III-fold pyridoxal phosphate-dependent enzyme, partial [Actinomycetales bacterium]|nr:aminotransferase class III-fold pyridoxal phosphate-dependent enzyme [Actinomycetales bacterium]